MEYEVIIDFDCIYMNVDADSVEEAKTKAMEKIDKNELKHLDHWVGDVSICKN